MPDRVTADEQVCFSCDEDAALDCLHCGSYLCWDHAVLHEDSCKHTDCPEAGEAARDR